MVYAKAAVIDFNYLRFLLILVAVVMVMVMMLIIDGGNCYDGHEYMMNIIIEQLLFLTMSVKYSDSAEGGSGGISGIMLYGTMASRAQLRVDLAS